MPFAIKFRERELNAGHNKNAMNGTLEFNERTVLENNVKYLKYTLNVSEVFLCLSKLWRN